MYRYSVDDDFSDFTIVSNGMTSPVHRLVISIHSGFFKRLCKSGFKETEERRVDLSENPPAAVALMIKYFYTFTITTEPDNLSGLPSGSYGPSSYGWGWFLIYAHLVVIADKYDVPELGSLATKRFDEQLNLVLTYTSAGKELRAATADLLEAIKYLYDNTAERQAEFRCLIVEAFQASNHRLLRYADEDDFHELISEVPEFAVDYIGAITGVTVGDKASGKKKLPSSGAQPSQ